MFVDVILPLPLPGVFTYELPPSMEVLVGCRVIVPFGRSKYYTAIVSRIHTEKPEGYVVKPVLEQIDTAPILLPTQLKLWEWMADYYLCSLGDVYKAALPSGLKLESDGEEIIGGFKPKEEVRVRLASEYQSEEALHTLFDQLAKTPKRLDLLMRWLELSCYFSGDIKEVSKHRLMSDANASVSAFNGLVSKGIFQTYMVEVGRLSSGSADKSFVRHKLNASQSLALQQITAIFQQKNVCLL
ncbi:MAG: primosomal protein N', partial [Bacteroidaceae bacterium]|nr:primosomal protein N' [Bacteroidaceae bacterium]